MSRRALVALLRMRGWKVSAVSTVADALGRLTPPPDCILLDLQLPDGDGEAVLRRVREGGLPTRVIVMTGLPDCARLDGVEGLRPHALLRKPLDVSGILMRCW